MISQQHERLVAEILNDPLPLIEVERDALIFMIGDTGHEKQRVLADRQQAIGLGGNAHAGVGMQVHDA